MNFTEKLVALTVAVLAADGKQEPEEIEAIRAIAKDYNLDEAEVNACIEKELANPTSATMAAKGLSKDEAQSIMEACTQVALSDKYINSEEVNLLLYLAMLMKLNPAKAVLAIATIAQNDRSILIEGSATLFDEDSVEVDED